MSLPNTHFAPPRRGYQRIFFSVWFLLIALPAMTWMASHHVPLPPPSGTQSAQPSSLEAGWRMVHVLAAECGCSGAVAEHLARRGATAGVAEEVWWIGETSGPTTPLAGSGFTVVPTSADTLQHRLGLEGAPWLLIYDPEGHLRYSGGYAATTPRRGAALEDRTLLARVQSGETVTPFPAYGCATSRRLQTALDPLGLKYSNPDRP